MVGQPFWGRVPPFGHAPPPAPAPLPLWRRYRHSRLGAAAAVSRAAPQLWRKGGALEEAAGPGAHLRWNALAQAPWLLMIETDYVWMKPVAAPLAESADLSIAFPFGYIQPTAAVLEVSNPPPPPPPPHTHTHTSAAPACQHGRSTSGTRPR